MQEFVNKFENNFPTELLLCEQKMAVNLSLTKQPEINNNSLLIDFNGQFIPYICSPQEINNQKNQKKSKISFSNKFPQSSDTFLFFTGPVLNSLIYSTFANQGFTFKLDNSFIPRYMNTFIDSEIFSAIFPETFDKKSNHQLRLDITLDNYTYPKVKFIYNKTVHKNGHIVVDLPLQIKIFDLEEQINKTEIIVNSIIVIDPLLYFSKLAFEINKLAVYKYVSPATVNQQQLDQLVRTIWGVMGSFVNGFFKRQSFDIDIPGIIDLIPRAVDVERDVCLIELDFEIFKE